MAQRISLPVRKLRQRQGFTLLEIMIVAALIALFSGLAVFSAQQMYDSNRRKAVFDEVKSIGTALSFSEQDIAFFPRIHLLGKPKTLVTLTANNSSALRPAFDTYGHLSMFTPQYNIVHQEWGGPYMGFSESRAGLAQGQKGLVWMRLPEPENLSYGTSIGASVGEADISLVEWPSDTWGNPYMVYLVVSDLDISSDTNPRGLRLINSAGEKANFMAAVVSYGPNGMPGGTDKIRRGKSSNGYVTGVLEAASLIVPGDLAGGGGDYTLKSFNSSYTQSSLSASNFNELLGQSMNASAADYDESAGAVGMLDTASDDILWRF